ncbi:MAG TPA: MbcA/ParS/Xre antitoxin family protein [Candidatus Elarobacter sp.]|jgi:putative toxin-antitoxin system antitoxin component (TIGR02293 family)|nr:MbcA/ParS/Xre antitoxin family protein [Candidatus Elarobacter sp.]
MTTQRRSKVQVAAADEGRPVSRIFRSLERLRGGVSLLDTTYRREEDALELASEIRAGLTTASWSDLRKTGFTAPELAAVIGVSEKTISRKQGSRELLGVAEGDRTLRLAQITLEAARAFGALDKAMRWLRKANRVLGGEIPLDLIATEPGTTLVRRVLGTIEYGGLA